MNLSAQVRNRSRLTIFKFSFVIVCAFMLSLAPETLLAQHAGGGGGSHGGGSSAGSHSGGTGHASGAGHSGPAAGSSSGSGGSSADVSSGGMHAGGASVGATHSSIAAANSSNAPYAGSHIWADPRAGSSVSSAPVERFAAGNNVWQDPPSARGGATVNSATSAKTSVVGANHAVTPRTRPSIVVGPHQSQHAESNDRLLLTHRPTTSVRGPLFGATQTPRPPIVFLPQPRHRSFSNNFFFFSGGCFGGFFPGFCGSSFWWGPGYAWGPDCDPVLGCTGYGHPNYVSDDADQMQVHSDTLPREEYGPFQWQESPAPDSTVDLASALAASKSPATIYLKDGSSYGVTDYWLSGGELHYVTNYGGENSISLERLDLQRTVDENAALGVSFILSNQPAPRQ